MAQDRVTYQAFIAYPAGKAPKPKDGVYKTNTALGWIIHRVNEGRLILMNKDTKLSRLIWSLGHTSKTAAHCIGGHGNPLTLKDPFAWTDAGRRGYESRHPGTPPRRL
jgi:hypothetical protein